MSFQSRSQAYQLEFALARAPVVMRRSQLERLQRLLCFTRAVTFGVTLRPRKDPGQCPETLPCRHVGASNESARPT